MKKAVEKRGCSETVTTRCMADFHLPLVNTLIRSPLLMTKQPAGRAGGGPARRAEPARADAAQCVMTQGLVQPAGCWLLAPTRHGRHVDPALCLSQVHLMGGRQRLG